MKEEFDFESIKNKTIEQLKAGKPLLGKDGAFAPLLESILNAVLEGEMDAHLTEEKRMLQKTKGIPEGLEMRLSGCK